MFVKAAANVDELLRIDESCAKESEVVFAALGPNAMECVNAGLRVFTAAAKWVGAPERVHPAGEEFNEIAEELKMHGSALWDVVRKPADPGGEDSRITKARGIDEVLTQSLALKTLLQLCSRAYRWGLTDFRRLRLTAAAGYMRVEAESIALMLLFVEKPSLSKRWLNPHENMMTFFKETQPSVKGVLKKHDLTLAYEHGSAVAQHARFASAARGIRVENADVQVLDQEFDPKQPVSFHLALAYFLRIQKRLFDLLPAVSPGLENDEEFKSSRSEFATLEDKTWWVMERKYEKDIKEFQERLAEN